MVVEPEQANFWSPSLPQFESRSPSSLSDTPASSSSRYMGSLGEQSALRNPVSLTIDATSLRPTMIWRNPLYPTWDLYETGQSPSEDNVKRGRSRPAPAVQVATHEGARRSRPAERGTLGWTLVINGASHCCCYYLVLRTACSDWPASQTSLLRKLLASRVGASHPLMLRTSDIPNAHLIKTDAWMLWSKRKCRGLILFLFGRVYVFICGYVVSMIFPGFQINECIYMYQSTDIQYSTSWVRMCQKQVSSSS